MRSTIPTHRKLVEHAFVHTILTWHRFWLIPFSVLQDNVKEQALTTQEVFVEIIIEQIFESYTHRHISGYDMRKCYIRFVKKKRQHMALDIFTTKNDAILYRLVINNLIRIK